MKLKSIKLRMSRSVRHAPYIISKPEVELEGELEVGDDDELEEGYKDLKLSINYILDDMEYEAWVKYFENKEHKGIKEDALDEVNKTINEIPF